MTNNTALFDAALAAIGDCNNTWLTAKLPADYNSEAIMGVAIATQIDAAIPPIITKATISQRDLLQSVVKSVMFDRSPHTTPPALYNDIAQAVASIFIRYSADLLNSDTGMGQVLPPGPLALIPNANLYAPGSVYYPTDDNYVYVNGLNHQWYVSIPFVPITPTVGDITSWVYNSPTPGYASLENRYAYTRMRQLIQNAGPEYFEFIPPIPNIIPGPVGQWTITAVFRYAGLAFANAVNLFQGIYIVLRDNANHRFMFGPQLTDSFLVNASACGFNGAVRQYFSSLTSKELSDLVPFMYTYFFRVRFNGIATYLTEYSYNGVDWSISVNGGINQFKWGVNPADVLIPTHWAVGGQFIPPGFATFDIIRLEQLPTF